MLDPSLIQALNFKANTEKEKGRERVALFQGAKPRTLEEVVNILLEVARAKELVEMMTKKRNLWVFGRT